MFVVVFIEFHAFAVVQFPQYTPVTVMIFIHREHKVPVTWNYEFMVAPELRTHVQTSSLEATDRLHLVSVSCTGMWCATQPYTVVLRTPRCVTVRFSHSFSRGTIVHRFDSYSRSGQPLTVIPASGVSGIRPAPVSEFRLSHGHIRPARKRALGDCFYVAPREQASPGLIVSSQGSEVHKVRSVTHTFALIFSFAQSYHQIAARRVSFDKHPQR